MEYKYFREVQPERGIQGNFASGQINYRILMDDKSTWNPSKSYIKIKMKLSRGDGARFDKDFGIAPNMFVCDNLFQQIDMRVGGVIVSEWNDYIAQCATLKNRLYKSLNQRESLMSSVNYAQIDLIDRISQISSDGRLEKDTVWRKGIYPGIAPLVTNGSTLNFLQLGVNAVQQVAANNSLIFLPNVPPAMGGNPIPDMSKYFSIGDNIYFTAAGGERTQLVTGYASTNTKNDTIIVDDGVNADVPAAVLGTNVRIHDKYYIDRLYSNSTQANDIELIWRPPIGFFDINDQMCGDCKLELTPLPAGIWEKYAVEAMNQLQVGNGGDDYAIEISEINLYIWTTVHSSSMGGSKSYTYSEIKCNSQNLTTSSLTSKNFNIHPRNYAVTLAFQDSAVGDDITLSRSKFIIKDDLQNKIVRYYINKDGITLPDPIPRMDISLNAGIARLQQRYYENYQYSGAYEHLDKMETFEEWLRAGIYFHYLWGKGYKRSDQLEVYTNFSQNFPLNPQILLFDHYHCSFTVNMSNGHVTSVYKG